MEAARQADNKARHSLLNARTSSITTLLFDWDGTLFDSAPAGWLAFQKTFYDLGIAFTEEFYETRYSPNWYAMYEALQLPKDKWKMADELWLEHYGEEPPKLVDGAGATLEELQARGYRLGIVTSGTERRVAREINLLGLSSRFEAVICNEHIVNKKPHPEGLEKAMSQMASPPDLCSYVGDAPEDIRMGKNALVFTVAVPSAYPTSKRLLDEQPDLHIESIAQLLLHF
jgi:HAD superfamily hydrolase (TIGR01509 family)